MKWIDLVLAWWNSLLVQFKIRTRTPRCKMVSPPSVNQCNDFWHYERMWMSVGAGVRSNTKKSFWTQQTMSRQITKWQSEQASKRMNKSNRKIEWQHHHITIVALYSLMVLFTSVHKRPINSYHVYHYYGCIINNDLRELSKLITCEKNDRDGKWTAHRTDTHTDRMNKKLFDLKASEWASDWEMYYTRIANENICHLLKMKALAIPAVHLFLVHTHTLALTYNFQLM